MSQETKESRSLISLPLILVLVALVIVVGAVYWGFQQQADPKEGSAEVGFARDMIVHHNQAVEMAILLYNRTENETLKSISLDIILTQQSQIGQMQAWLALWGRPFAGTEKPMAWMDMPTDGLMPGMATEEQMNALREATGAEADALFLPMMIAHHQGGLHMAETVIERTDVDAVRELAESMKEAQESEIETMRQLAEELGVEL